MIQQEITTRTVIDGEEVGVSTKINVIWASKIIIEPVLAADGQTLSDALVTFCWGVTDRETVKLSDLPAMGIDPTATDQALTDLFTKVFRNKVAPAPVTIPESP